MRYLKILSENTRGENNRRAVLTEQLVCQIRRAYRDGEKPLAISRRLGLNLSTVRNVTSGRGWQHLK